MSKRHSSDRCLVSCAGMGRRTKARQESGPVACSTLLSIVAESKTSRAALRTQKRKEDSAHCNETQRYETDFAHRTETQRNENDFAYSNVRYREEGMTPQTVLRIRAQSMRSIKYSVRSIKYTTQPFSTQDLMDGCDVRRKCLSVLFEVKAQSITEAKFDH